MPYLTVMYKYLQVSSTGTPKKSPPDMFSASYASISNALARYADAPPVPRLSTGNSRFSPHPYWSSSKTLSDWLAPPRIARRFARPSGLLT